MRQHFYKLALTIALWSCYGNTEKSVNSNSMDSLSTTNLSYSTAKFYKTDCDRFETNKQFEIRAYSETLRVFVEACPVYCSPNDTSKIVDTLKFNTAIKLTEVIKTESSGWFRISNNDKSLFVKSDHLTLKPYDYSGYLAGFTIVGKTKTITLKSIAKDNSSEASETYTFSKNYSTYKIENLLYNGLYKAGILIKCMTLHSTDPTSYYYEFVIFNQEQKTFKKLISYSSTYVDACEFEEEIIYFPMKFENGKILLVKDADYENIFNYQTAELNTIEYPKQVNIPIDQLLLKVVRRAECVTDKEGLQIIDPKTENPKMKIVEEKPVYFKWDGEILKEN